MKKFRVSKKISAVISLVLAIVLGYFCSWFFPKSLEDYFGNVLDIHSSDYPTILNDSCNKTLQDPLIGRFVKDSNITTFKCRTLKGDVNPYLLDKHYVEFSGEIPAVAMKHILTTSPVKPEDVQKYMNTFTEDPTLLGSYGYDQFTFGTFFADFLKSYGSADTNLTTFYNLIPDKTVRILYPVNLEHSGNVKIFVTIIDGTEKAPPQFTEYVPGT